MPGDFNIGSAPGGGPSAGGGQGGMGGQGGGLGGSMSGGGQGGGGRGGLGGFGGLLSKDTAVPGQKEALSGKPSDPVDGAKSKLDFSLAQADVPGRTDSARRRMKRPADGITGGEGAILGSKDAVSVDAGPDYTYSRFRFHKGDEVNPYAQVRDAQVGMDPRLKKCIALGVLVVVSLLCAILIPSGWFSMNMSGMTTASWLAEFQNHVRGFVSLITFQGADYSMDAITYRYLIVALAGAALGISGAVYQGSLKNALASPSTLGVMTGCNLGRIVYVMLFYQTGAVLTNMHVSEIQEIFDGMSPLEYLWTAYGTALSALIGGFAVAASVLLIATVAGRGRVSNVVMIIAGQVFATVIGAVTSLMQYYLTYTGDARAELLRGMQVESFSLTFRALDVVLVGVPVIICIVIIMMQRNKLNLLAFSDDEARSMGMSTQRSRWIMVGTCTALTGVIVAFCGQIGMVGFMVPHLVRKFIGPDFKYLVPAAALTGSAFLVITYFATSLFEEGILNSFGVYTSIIGGVVFLVLALKQRGQTRGDWL